jgi:hypothetical protein
MEFPAFSRHPFAAADTDEKSGLEFVWGQR